LNSKEWLRKGKDRAAWEAAEMHRLAVFCDGAAMTRRAGQSKGRAANSNAVCCGWVKMGIVLQWSGREPLSMAKQWLGKDANSRAKEWKRYVSFAQQW